ncbi:hypothetical protein ENSA5_02900 [Enhygromyxa salina]|uniref:Uncharacterized protein n=2 Tax=Enhygromyxa salina TaxID=215803 RepID=A0A2S9YJR0_9BACT|nr:hypothetical protein ENSA5_02900 [Enhygromyxa salina]
MASFAAELRPTSSLERLEASFASTFGVSLEQAVADSVGVPMPMFDALPCDMPGLPRSTWADDPLVLTPGEADCSDADVVGSGGQALWFVV